MTKTSANRSDAMKIAIVGGGLAGLTAAAFAARSGRCVTVYEKAPEVGGRAASRLSNGFTFNQGPHALYRGGAAAAVLTELAVAVQGGVPSQAGGFAVHGGRLHTLPVGFVSLITTDLLGVTGKLETARLLARLPKLDVSDLARTSAAEWLDGEVADPIVRELVAALFRLTSYAHAPALHSAASALRQLQLALKAGVTYLDGGWQSLVDRIRTIAVGYGAHIETRAKVETIEPGAVVHGLRLAGGDRVEAAAVVVAAGPATVAALLGPRCAMAADWAKRAVPVRAACLDVALRRLPRPRATFALGVDEPLYLSVHSAAARLAPSTEALVHVARYLAPDQKGDRDDEARLLALLDQVQPGWRAHVVERRFLPSMVVSNALVKACDGGDEGRPSVTVPGIDRLYVAGDWVGPDGVLADASLASARRVAHLLEAGEAVRDAA